MKWLIAFLLIFFTGCSVIITPLTKHRPVHYRNVKRHHKVSTDYSLVDSEWLAQYRKLKNEHGNYNISSDEEIRTTPNGKFLVPKAVRRHFDDLIHTPLATPTP